MKKLILVGLVISTLTIINNAFAFAEKLKTAQLSDQCINDLIVKGHARKNIERIGASCAIKEI